METENQILTTSIVEKIPNDYQPRDNYWNNPTLVYAEYTALTCEAIEFNIQAAEETNFRSTTAGNLCHLLVYANMSAWFQLLFFALHDSPFSWRASNHTPNGEVVWFYAGNRPCHLRPPTYKDFWHQMILRKRAWRRQIRKITIVDSYGSLVVYAIFFSEADTKARLYMDFGMLKEFLDDTVIEMLANSLIPDDGELGNYIPGTQVLWHEISNFFFEGCWY